MNISKPVLVAVLVGFVLGLSLSQLLSSAHTTAYRDHLLSALRYQWEQLRPSELPPGSASWPPALPPSKASWPPAPARGTNDHSHLEDLEGPKEKVVFHDDEHVHEGEDVEARQLAEHVRVLCWIMTGPENHRKKVRIPTSSEPLTWAGRPCEGYLGQEVQHLAVHELRGGQGAGECCSGGQGGQGQPLG